MEKVLSGKPEKSGEKQKKDTKWKPGQSGNPKGKPIGTISVVSVIKRVLQERAKTIDGSEKERLEVLARNIVAMAIQNQDKDMIKLIVNYVDGLPKQSMDLDIGLKPDLQELAKSIQQIANEQITRTGKKTVQG